MPKNLREQRLITKIKQDEDQEKIQERKKLTENMTPAQLGQMTSVADLPVPRPLENFLKADSKKAKENVEERR